jgi:hypothetical protein
MPRFALASIALAVLVLAGCSGGDGDRTAGIIHRLLLASQLEDPSALESFVGKLPDDLPIEPPLYPEADLIVSSRAPAPELDGAAAPGVSDGTVPQPVLYFLVLDTDADREHVFTYYQERLDSDPWQLEGSFSSPLLDTLQFSNVEDPDLSGAVSIARGGDDGRTSILVSLQDAGAFREELPPFEPDPSLPLPKDFPPEIPAYEGAIVTDSAFFREPGSESFLIVFLTKDSQSDVIDFYKDEFEERGWKVTDLAPVELEEQFEFQDPSADIQGELLADRFDADRTYTEVRLQLRVNPSREPPSEDGDETPTSDEGETPEETP